MQQFSSLIILTLIYSSTCFGRFPSHHQELNDCSSSLWFYFCVVVIVVHDCHHNTKVKPEAATAVIELLMMGGKTPKTCWAVNKRQDNKLENGCIWLVIYLNCTIMHGLTNLTFKFRFHIGLTIACTQCRCIICSILFYILRIASKVIEAHEFVSLSVHKAKKSVRVIQRISRPTEIMIVHRDSKNCFIFFSARWL